MTKDLIQRIDMLYINIGIILSAILTISISIFVYTLKCNRQKRTYLTAFESLINRYGSIDDAEDKISEADTNISTLH